MKYNFYLKKFINILIKSGKKIRAKQLLFDSFFYLQIVYNVEDPFFFFFKSLIRTVPCVELISFKKGNKTIKLPRVSSLERRVFLGIRWLVEAASVSKRSLSKGLCLELYNLSVGRGSVLEKRSSLHKQAEVYRMYLSLKSLF